MTNFTTSSFVSLNDEETVTALFNAYYFAQGMDWHITPNGLQFGGPYAFHVQHAPPNAHGTDVEPGDELHFLADLQQLTDSTEGFRVVTLIDSALDWLPGSTVYTVTDDTITVMSLDNPEPVEHPTSDYGYM